MANDINIKLTIDGKEANATISSLDGRLEELKSDAEKSGSSFGNSWAMALTGINQGLQLVQQALGVLSKPIEGAAQFEGYETSLKVMLGSTEAAQKRLEELVQFASSTPFELPQVIQLGNQLQAVGKYSQDTMRDLGDLASASGKPIEQVIGAFGKLATGQKGVAVDMFRDLLISTKDWENAVGKSIDKITSDEMLGALPKIMKEKGFAGMMEEQSKTFNGIMSNMQDAVGGVLRDIGKKILPLAKELVGAIIPILTFIKENLNTIGMILAGLTTAYIVHFATLKGGIIIQTALAVLEKARLITMLLQTTGLKGLTLAQLGLNTAMVSSLATLGLIAGAVAGLISLYVNLTGAMRNYEESARLQTYYSGATIGFDAAKKNAELIKEQFGEKSISEIKKQIELRNKEIERIDKETNYNAGLKDRQQITLYQEEIKHLQSLVKEKEKAAQKEKEIQSKGKTKEQAINDELGKWKDLVDVGIKGQDEYLGMLTKYYDEYDKIIKSKGEKATRDEIGLYKKLFDEINNLRERGIRSLKIEGMPSTMSMSIDNKGYKEKEKLKVPTELTEVKENKDELKEAQEFYLDIISSQYDKEMQMINDKYAMLNEYRAKDLISETQYQQAVLKLKEEETSKDLDLTQQSLATGLGLFAKHTAMYKAMAIAQATIDTYKGINAALSLPFPLNWIQGALILATGLSNVATITGIAVPNEGFAEGGLLPKGKSGIIEGWHNEIIAPEKTFVDVMNTNIIPKLNNDNGLIYRLENKLNELALRFERKQFVIKGNDLYTINNKQEYYYNKYRA